MLVQFGQILLDLGFKGNEIVVNHMEHTFGLYLIIVVYQHMPHPLNILPRSLRMSFLEFF